MKVGGCTKVLGLIGDPVEHTLSPAIHNTLSRMLNGINESVYVPFHVSAEGLESALKGAFELGICGLNVTVPHKSAIIPYLDGIDDKARAIGAVNTLVMTDKGYKGYNTDAEGFERELAYYGIRVSGERAVILGAGGAARAAAFALAGLGAEEIFICNRTRDKAEDIAASVNSFYKKDIAVPLAMDETERVYDRDYIAIQCTSVGLYPDVTGCAAEDGAFFDHAICGVDMVYKPRETEFMKRLKKRGKRAYNGLRMLLYQAVAAYEMFMREKCDDRICERAAFNLMYAQRPIALVGYMGSGKSSVGKILADMLGCPFLDSDEEIVKASGRSINKIFEQEGEGAFREMETGFLESLKDRQGVYVLSTGGGMAMKEENRRLLREEIGALVVYLTASPGVICSRVSGDTARPLLKEGEETLMEKVTRMLSERESGYEAASCITIATDGLSAYDVAHEIKEFEL